MKKMHIRFLGLMTISLLFQLQLSAQEPDPTSGYAVGYPDITYDYVGGPVPISNPIVTYASWGDQNNRNIGLLFIYPLADGTELNLFQETSTTSPIQISTLVLTVSGAQKDVPIQFGPLTAPQHFFKLESNKPVNWELITPNYDDFREASRFVASENRNFLGTKFVFHADDGTGFGVSQGTEEIVIINPGASASTVTIEKFNTGTGMYDPAVATTVIPGGDFDEFAVNVSGLGKAAGKSLGTGRGHYRVTVTNGPPVLVWEGRWLFQNDAIGAAPDGSTIGSTIFASTPNDPVFDGTSKGPKVRLRILGITAASYTVSSSAGPGLPFTVDRTGAVAAGAVASETGLTEDRLYKITTSSPAEKIQVQYHDGSGGGAEMIGGNDGGVTTNPGTSFLLYFQDNFQESVDVLIPQAGTFVTVSGPSSTSLTSTVPDQVMHFLASGEGVYTVTASAPVWVVVTSQLGDQQGYFVYTSERVTVEFNWDLKFCSLPNTFNCKRTRGNVPLTIFGSADLDVNDIDQSSLRLALASSAGQTGAPASSLPPGDRGSPGDVDNADTCVFDDASGLNVENPDGFPDLDVGFSAAEVASLVCPIAKKSFSAPLTVTGTLLDGTPLEALNTQVLRN